MIYLANITDAQAVAIPLEEPWALPGEGEIYTLTLRSTFNAADIAVTYNGSDDDGISEFGHYALVDIELPADLPDGSYEYRFCDPSGQVVASGCVTIGDYAPDVTRYDKTVEYEQYN